MTDRPFFVLYVLVCLEIGIFLMLVPWSAVWERNYFLQAVPALEPFVTSPWLRGAVAGLGVANIYMAFNEIATRRQEMLPMLDEPAQGDEASDRSEPSRGSGQSWATTKE